MQTPTQKQITEWKETHGDVYELPIDDKVCYLKSPSMADWKRAFTAMQNGGDIAFSEAMLAACWLGGDNEIKTDDAYFLPASKEIRNLFNYDDAELSKVNDNCTLIMIGGNSAVVRPITRQDIRNAERKNPSSKPLVTQELLFDMICVSKDEAFEDRNNVNIRFPLYQAIEGLKTQKDSALKKL
jgi:hypothetical protein